MSCVPEPFGSNLRVVKRKKKKSATVADGTGGRTLVDRGSGNLTILLYGAEEKNQSEIWDQARAESEEGGESMQIVMRRGGYWGELRCLGGESAEAKKPKIPNRENILV